MADLDSPCFEWDASECGRPAPSYLFFRRPKRASSRRIRQECWDRVKSRLWGKFFWSGGYFYRSVGSTTDEAIQYYIERSQEKHWTALDHEEYERRRDRRQS